MDKKVPLIFASGNFDSHFDQVSIAHKHYALTRELREPIVHIVLQHGALEYHRRHFELIEFLLNTFGDHALVSCMDLPGHGMSGGSRMYIDEFDSYCHDYVNFLSICDDFSKGRKREFHLIGHSLGGMITIKALSDFKESLPMVHKTLTLCNPCIRPTIGVPKRFVEFMEKPSLYLGKLRLPSPNSGKDLTNDRARAIAFDADQLNSHFMTLRMGREIILASYEMMNYAYFLDIPTLFLISSLDKVVDPKSTELFAVAMGKSLAKTIVYPGAKHDLFNETCRAEVFREVSEFFTQKEL